MTTMLDDLMPTWDHREHHEIVIDAPVDIVWHSLQALKMRDMPVWALLSLARAPWKLPQLARPSHLNAAALDAAPVRPLVSSPPTELVMTGVADYTSPKTREASLPEGDVEAFRKFKDFGWTKSAMNFSLAAQGQQTVLRTETRVLSTDDATRARFARYWLLIRVGSATIRREILHAVGRTAEKRARSMRGMASELS